IVDEDNQSTTVVVPDYQLSLAIGKRGQNARLAAKLTGWKIDIKSETDAREAGIYPVPEQDEVEETPIEEDLSEDVVVAQVEEVPEVEEVEDVEAEEAEDIEAAESEEDEASEETEAKKDVEE
ncbi:MAG: transcription termination/antitermination protein NusA, partial [Staphylococcus simulans]|nr:transcription termination/antitermination protein NusA [Staphylococcus simulans]